MKKILVAFIVFNIFIINLYANGIAMSTQSDTNSYSWIKGRQIISVNLSPGYAGLFPSLINNIFDNYKTFAGLADLNTGDIDKYLNAVEAKGSFWYVPNISYTLLLHPRIGIEIGFGVQAMSFQLGIPRDKIGDLADSFLPSTDQGGDIGNIIGDNIDTLIGSDTSFKASMIYFPATIGIKFYGGKKRQVVNTFRFGVEAFMYDIETENGLTGLKTKRHTVDTTLYLSYELGWTIELFPTREWPVKPYIDMKAGYSELIDEEHDGGEYNSGGFYFSPSIGVSLPVVRKTSVHIGLGYTYNRAIYEFSYIPGDGKTGSENKTFNAGGITLSVGVSF